MPRRSLSDVPNRLVRIFLEAAGRQYDMNRGLVPYSRLTPALIARFDGRCAYCGEAKALVEEHVVPINRTDVGLHAWGNIVPACRDCNKIKKGDAWETHPRLDDLRQDAIQACITDYKYDPDVTELRNVVEKLYVLANTPTRALVDFGLVASQPYIAGLHSSATIVEPSVAAGYEQRDSDGSSPRTCGVDRDRVSDPDEL